MMLRLAAFVPAAILLLLPSAEAADTGTGVLDYLRGLEKQVDEKTKGLYSFFGSSMPASRYPSLDEECDYDDPNKIHFCPPAVNRRGIALECTAEDDASCSANAAKSSSSSTTTIPSECLEDPNGSKMCRALMRELKDAKLPGIDGVPLDESIFDRSPASAPHSFVTDFPIGSISTSAPSKDMCYGNMARPGPRRHVWCISEMPSVSLEPSEQPTGVVDGQKQGSSASDKKQDTWEIPTAEQQEGGPSDEPSEAPSGGATDKYKLPTSAEGEECPDESSAPPTGGPMGVPTTGPNLGSPSPVPVPSASPSTIPSDGPSDSPTEATTASPVTSETPTTSTPPSESPSVVPSDGPSESPTKATTSGPTGASGSPTTSTEPSTSPSTIPSDAPSDMPSTGPSSSPTTCTLETKYTLTSSSHVLANVGKARKLPDDAVTVTLGTETNTVMIEVAQLWSSNEALQVQVSYRTTSGDADTQLVCDSTTMAAASYETTHTFVATCIDGVTDLAVFVGTADATLEPCQKPNEEDAPTTDVTAYYFGVSCDVCGSAAATMAGKGDEL